MVPLFFILSLTPPRQNDCSRPRSSQRAGEKQETLTADASTASLPRKACSTANGSSRAHPSCSPYSTIDSTERKSLFLLHSCASKYSFCPVSNALIMLSRADLRRPFVFFCRSRQRRFEPSLQGLFAYKILQDVAPLELYQLRSETACASSYRALLGLPFWKSVIRSFSCVAAYQYYSHPLTRSNTLQGFDKALETACPPCRPRFSLEPSLSCMTITHPQQ